MIFGPDGKPLCEPVSDGEETILKADVNLRDIDYPKAFIDVVGHCKKRKSPNLGTRACATAPLIQPVACLV